MKHNLMQLYMSRAAVLADDGMLGGYSMHKETSFVCSSAKRYIFAKLWIALEELALTQIFWGVSFDRT